MTEDPTTPEEVARLVSCILQDVFRLTLETKLQVTSENNQIFLRYPEYTSTFSLTIAKE